MEDKSIISNELKYADLAQNGIQETIDNLHNQASSILHLSLQWKDLGRHFSAICDSVESRYRELEEREKDLELRRESLERRSREVEGREREFDLRWRRELEEVRGESERVAETARGLDSVKLDVEGKLRELREEESRLKGILKAIEDRGEELKVIERGLKERSSEFVLKEMELTECLLEFNLEEGRFKEKERELGLMEKNYQGRISELEHREKRFEMIKENFDSKEDRLEREQRRFKERKRKFERRLRDLESNKKRYDRQEEELWERKRVLEMKEQRVEERSRVLEQAEKESAKRIEELESRERQLNERCKDLELKKEQCEQIYQACKTNMEPIGYPYVEPECKKGKFCSTPDNRDKNGVDGSMDADLHFCVTMDGKALQIFLNERSKDHDIMRDEVFVALQLSSNPAKLVLDAMQWFYPPHLKREDTEYDENVVRRSCIILLEQLRKISPPIMPNVRNEAMKLAFNWITRMRVDEEHSLQVLGFLLLLASYGLAFAFDSDELLSYMEVVARHSQAPEILRALGLADKIHDVIQNFIFKEQNPAAVRFICAFELENEFPPVPLLRKCIYSCKKLSRNLNSKDHISLQEQDEASKRRLDDLKGLVKCIEKHKLESDFSFKILKEAVAMLDERINNGEPILPHLGEIGRNAQLLVLDEEMCITPALGPEVSSMPAYTVVTSRTISPDAAAPPSNAAFQLDRCSDCPRDVDTVEDYLNSNDGAAPTVPSVRITCLSPTIFPTGQGNAAEVFGTSRPEEKVNLLMNVTGGNAGDAAKPKESGTSNSMGRKRRRKSAEESGDSFEIGIRGDNVCTCNEENSDDGSSHQPIQSRRQNQDFCYMSCPTMKRRNRSSTSREEKNEATLDDGAHEKYVKQKASTPLKEISPNEKSGTGEGEGKDETLTLASYKYGDDSEQNDNFTKEPVVVEFPDPEFSDFDKGKGKNCFAVNQIWAVYDERDCMPRYYARVKKIFSPGFRLQISWLEPNPDDEVEQEWHETDLPVACGKYATGSTEETVDFPMFSHQMYVKRTGGGSYLIYPRKGETWAIFKNWNINWRSEPKNHKPPNQVEYVEILSDFSENFGIAVAYLWKLKGFVSLFQRTDELEVIPREHLYKFSHHIPSFTMTGKEKEGVPVGSFELDPACLLPDPELGIPGEEMVEKESLEAETNQTS
ncbi:putative DNAJ heat shock N-terminal domain-containing protein [Tripterygium wilfordii]|uniref:Putative DNAJ heat shock N-terminal domain-containing protein n=1 Tax=Tripterygium wilfordii TaxID=458696 RepID=A0A7J7D2J6_TRIWF|nr:uncharacterized protein LOC120009120 [Tripterygium wilfordii]XP_038715510.1 uncharacterized protein LOC120009120 [Tripterygium wilfordii]KAF5740567.1 putative DNAJ heat shock N-terminal domain-containing protein [Tripterygium wilfordii]